jgi:hypothetical protein
MRTAGRYLRMAERSRPLVSRLKYLAPLILLSYDDVGDFTGEHSWFFSQKVDDWSSPVVVRLTPPFAL